MCASLWLLSSALTVPTICFPLSVFNLKVDLAVCKHFLDGKEGLRTGVSVLGNLENTDGAGEGPISLGSLGSVCAKSGQPVCRDLRNGGWKVKLSSKVVPKSVIIWAS